jgi:hypothetical protein
VRPAGKKDRSRRPLSSSSAADDYQSKAGYEISVLSRRSERSSHPAPLGDPSSGVVVVVEHPVNPRILQALSLSLQAVNLAQAYVTFASTDTLAEEILATEPHALVAIGPAAARKIDALDYPLAQNAFSDAAPGAWFAWTKGTAGLVLPPLAPALDDGAAKKRFWHAFLSLRDLAPD